MFLVLTGGMAYLFVYQGSVRPAADGRTAIVLEPGERALILAEMRAFVESVQQITTGLSQEDMETVVEAARKSGRAAQQQVPVPLMGKLPLAFKQLGLDTHQQFDQLALDAEQLGDPAHSLQQLGRLMQNCVACHAAYRLEVQ
ncbi:cytochrome c [Thiohalobacter thiocyanaticus]|uniref:cytochrome c n=1 Tax=Thiohalobacter thiocyanaticus TaxID=585455 RepID=UPI0019D4D282|nr:cytochrome c [Thiohalobacter thiocyanaticus]